jgi:hypothetical protein
VDENVQVPVTAVVPVTLRLAGQLTVRPVDGVVDGVMLTVPVKPFSGVTVRVDDAPVAPLLKLTGEVAVNVKSFAALNV